jgi:hypothetical protein
MRRKIALFSLVLIAVFFQLSVAHAQEKVDAPVWNVGDKWIFSNKGTIEVVSADQDSYVLRFSDDICIGESWGCNTIIFEKNTLYRIYTLNGDKRKKYTKAKRRIFNFPLSPGKQWKDVFSTTSVVAPGYGVLNYSSVAPLNATYEGYEQLFCTFYSSKGLLIVVC